ncbi:G-type lectin S-receptor-like serine/threonine-protein kinase At1g11300 [Cicer arietinum]|uniref:non-specific serine/threonine protein kinase n=1 Tax=Cicer arietinum TaxID=3827 RepID=A0A3Q7WX08_CICAR|nr:G-type lectin S-receptor-like serine/threonine-protein kinase At1g11300 [Cicer arietinum]
MVRKLRLKRLSTASGQGLKEFMNSDSSESKILDWSKRFSIIERIARGLLYLHRDSRLKIILRDLKPSNILLDNELNPKISYFGTARIFGGSEDQENTRRVVGTYDYMSPEYAMQGMFSDKSDVFSFRVLLLEIVSGRRNSSFYDCEDSLTLLGFEFSIDRPTMSVVVYMLNSEIVDLPPPKKPAFILRQNMLSTVSSEESNDGLYSINLASISDSHGR